MKKVKIGVIGLIHDHVWWILNQIKTIEKAEITCVADFNYNLLEKVKSDYGIKKTYRSYGDLLSKEKLDAVFLYLENSRHADMTEAAAEKGLHVMVEKPMAAKLSQAQRMIKAAERAGIKLMVNFPSTWNPTTRHAVKLAKGEVVGKIYLVRNRAAHKGPKEIGCNRPFYEWLYNAELNGAGAYMDFCCYGANISRWLLGVPEKATALGGTYVREYLKVEDNAILLMGYKDAMGIAEASWSQVGNAGPLAYPLVLYGSKGVIASGADLLLYTEEKNDWQRIEPDQPEEGCRNASDHFIKCILEDKPFDESVSASHNRDVQAILEAGLISLREGRTVYLNELF